ncbi:MAG: PAS domain S-box protein [Bacteroidota bacterium]
MNGNIKKIIGVKVSEFYKNDPKILNDFRQCLNQKTIIEREINYALLLSNERKYLNVKYAFVPPDLVIVHTEDITERKLSEIKLTNSELSLKQAQEIAGMGNWDFDLINNKNSWSENCFNIFGLKPNEVDPTFEYFKSRIHPDDVHLIDDSLEEISKNRIPVQLDMRILFPLGEIKWFRNNIIPFFEGGKLVLIKGVNIDITERKKTEEELKESEHKYKELFEVNTDGITLFYINEQDGSISNIIDANENSAKMLGYTKEEILQFNPNDLEKDKTLEKIEKRKFDLLTKGFSNFETTILHKDGHEISVEIRVILVNYNNRPSLMNIVRDITERKQAEEVIRQSESLLRSITETTSDVIFVKDKEYRFLFINPAGCKLYNKTLEELIGKSKADFHTNPLEVEKFFADDKRIMESGKIEVIEEEVGYADGYIHTFLTTKVPRLDGQGNIIGLIGVAHDITERKQVELDLLKAKDRAEESDRLKSAFLANMSHEIRTPMNGIMGFAELLKEPQLTGEDQINYINIIQKSGVRMLNIINDIISISKIEAGLMEVSLSETNFNEQLDYIFTFFKPETESKGVKLSYNKFLPLNDALINTDKEKVYSILTNLVKNAIKYTDKGSINFGYTIKDGFIVFYVKDTGIGVPVNRQVAIFERFIQADIEDKRALQGAGLGLAITKAYVEMLGGEIWLESEDGKGSVFYFTIPYVKVVEDTTVVYNFYKNDIEINNTSLKILVVEDDEISDLFITRVLDKISKKVLHVRNGIDAVDIVRSNSDIDLILMDVNLPEMDGYEAVRHIREFNKDVIIIAQTAYALIGEKEKAIENGCNNYLSKPIDQALLKSLIKFYFNNP